VPQEPHIPRPVPSSPRVHGFRPLAPRPVEPPRRFRPWPSLPAPGLPAARHNVSHVAPHSHPTPFGLFLRRKNGLFLVFPTVRREGLKVMQQKTATYGYARVSTQDQDCVIQREALKKAGCSMVCEEKASGTSRNGRTELERLLGFKILRATRSWSLGSIAWPVA
jgi:hypothetical protein